MLLTLTIPWWILVLGGLCFVAIIIVACMSARASLDKVIERCDTTKGIAIETRQEMDKHIKEGHGTIN